MCEHTSCISFKFFEEEKEDNDEDEEDEKIESIKKTLTVFSVHKPTAIRYDLSSFDVDDAASSTFIIEGSDINFKLDGAGKVSLLSWEFLRNVRQATSWLTCR